MVGKDNMRISHGRLALTLALLAIVGRLDAQQPITPTDSLHAAVQALTVRLDVLAAGGCPTGPAIILPSSVGLAPQADSLARAVEVLNPRLEAQVASCCGTGIAAFTDLGLAPVPSVPTTNRRPISVAPTQTWLASTHSRAPPRSLS